ncbi:MAG: membrane protein insertase YidC [Ktedonobacteraceae bacterium]|nr:membrane protein insertase YidC [Ktedonobacteraceae bacterium]
MGEIGNFFFVIFTQPIYNGLMALFQLFGDFGLAIIVLTLVIKLILFPLTLQQLKSMKANQALQPHMAEVRKKYANDKQAQALAMQALYKEYGINPLGGCLPMLVQLPVLYGLFYALNEVLRNAHTVPQVNQHLYPFIPHFTTFPDINLNWFTIFNAGWHISLGAPDPTHILPIIAGLATFVQLRMSQPKTVGDTKNDPTAGTMKTMQYIMPVMTAVIGWSFPAGLALYWTVSALFQAVQQYFVTGWGSLLAVPNLKKDIPKTEPAQSVTSNGDGKAYKGEQKRETARQTEVSTESNGGAISSRLRTSTYGSGSSSQNNRRRQRGGSASARRRSTQRSRG